MDEATIDTIPAYLLAMSDKVARIGREEAARLDREEKRFSIPAQLTTKRKSELKAKPQGDLEALNDRYCVVSDQGRTRVLYFEEGDDFEDEGHSRKIARFMSFDDFKNLHLNRKVTVPTAEGGKKKVPMGKWWLEHPERRQYSGLTFLPGGEKEIGGKLNLWQGWGIPPKKGDWSKLRRHIEEVLAGGDQEAADYIIRWVAWAFQNPHKRAEAALVFRGKKGTGKGTLGNALCKVFGQHGIHISSADHLAGRFNAHLRDACLLFADEAYWPGNKAAEGNLKRLVTEPDLIIEGKGKDSFPVRNMLHVLMASNEGWVVPAGEGERRYVVLDVPDTKMQDPSWFKPIHEEMREGGLGAMLYDLLAMDLEGWHPRQIIKTEGLREQVLESLGPEEQWFLSLLQDGTIPGAEPGTPDMSFMDDVEVDGRIKRGLLSHARASSSRLNTLSSHKLGKYLTDRHCWKPGKRNDHGKRLWKFPPLQQARAEWEKRFGAWTWDHPEQEEWEVYTGAPDFHSKRNGPF